MILFFTLTIILLLITANILTFVKADNPIDPIDTGLVELRAKVNATYARGDSWSITYEDGVYK